jgi:bifunctional enzyme CysN/CysC
VRSRHEAAGQQFVEVYIATPLEVCEQRDPKGLYRRARAGEQLHFTGVDEPYEAPERAEVVVSTEQSSPAEVATIIVRALD